MGDSFYILRHLSQGMSGMMSGQAPSYRTAPTLTFASAGVECCARDKTSIHVLAVLDHDSDENCRVAVLYTYL